VSKSNDAGVSVSVMFSLGTGTSFFAAIAFYFIFKEKLMLQHILGMVLLGASVIVIGFSKGSFLAHE